MTEILVVELKVIEEVYFLLLSKHTLQFNISVQWEGLYITCSIYIAPLLMGRSVVYVTFYYQKIEIFVSEASYCK